ncbi:Hypothetical predicted protein [Scomber scombrus]|uniref:Uncharacterized protein n=1 Tax=Scomber scombrus TaxID=13677 RepID=A0AAV1MSU6_SCOSC
MKDSSAAQRLPVMEVSTQTFQMMDSHSSHSTHPTLLPKRGKELDVPVYTHDPPSQKMEVQLRLGNFGEAMKLYCDRSKNAASDDNSEMSTFVCEEESIRDRGGGKRGGVRDLLRGQPSKEEFFVSLH